MNRVTRYTLGTILQTEMFSYDLFTVMVKSQCWILIFPQVQISTEHYERVSIIPRVMVRCAYWARIDARCSCAQQEPAMT